MLHEGPDRHELQSICPSTVMSCGSLTPSRYSATNLKVVQPATFVPEPVSPKKSIVLVLALFAATFGGLSIALVYEFLDYSFQTPEQVENTLKLPVLLSIPQLTRQRKVLH